MLVVFEVILIIISVLLCLLILFQESKGGGLAGALSGYGMKSAFGAKSAEKLTIFTAYVAGVFFILVMILGIWGKPSGGIVTKSIKEPPAQEAPAEAPAEGAETPGEQEE